VGVGGDGDAEGGFVLAAVVPDLESVGVVEVALQVAGVRADWGSASRCSVSERS
jgi:hypothetical protein